MLDNSKKLFGRPISGGGSGGSGVTSIKIAGGPELVSGTSAVIPIATINQAGVMRSVDKERLDLMVQPVYVGWNVGGYYEFAVIPQGFTIENYPTVQVSFLNANALDNPVFKVDGQTYDIYVAGKRPKAGEILAEDTCFLGFKIGRVETFALDTHKTYNIRSETEATDALLPTEKAVAVELEKKQDITIYTTTGAVNAYALAIPDISSYSDLLNKPIYVKFHLASTSNTININVNGLGNVRLYSYGTINALPTAVRLNQIITIVYDGVNFVFIDGVDYSRLGVPTVSQGGTGRTTQTANALLAGGTSTTTAQQSIPNGLTSGMLLKSNGTNTLPSFDTLDNLGIATTTELNNIVINSVAQPQAQIYLVSGNGTANGTFGLQEPIANQIYPTTVTTTATLRNTFSYIFPNAGFVSTLSTWQLILRLTNLAPQQTYTILGNVKINVGGADTILSTLSNFTFQTGNSQTAMEIILPFLQNTLTANKSYNANDVLRIELTWNKGNGNSETITINSIATNPVTFIRNGGEVGASLVIYNDGINTQTLAQVLNDNITKQVSYTSAQALAGLAVIDNQEISISDTVGNITIISANGTGSIRFTAGTTAITLPSGQGWDGGVVPNIISGKIYTVVWDRGTWYCDRGR